MKFLTIILSLLISLTVSEAQDILSINKSIDSINKTFEQKNISNNLRVKVFSTAGLKYLNSKEYYKALMFYKQALIHCDTNFATRLKGMKNLLGDIYYKMGKISEKLFDTENELEYYFKARQIFNAIHDYDNEADVTESIADLYTSKGFRLSGLKYYLLSRKYYLTNIKQFKQKLIKNTCNIGSVFNGLHKNDTAIIWYKIALNYVDNTSDLHQKVRIYNNIGFSYYEKNWIDSAYYYYSYALKYLGNENNDRYSGVINLNIGEVKMKKKRYNEAINYFNKALTHLLKAKAFDNLILLYQDLKNYNKEIKNYKDYLYYSEKYIDLKDSLSSSEKLIKLAEIEKINDLRTKEDKILLIEKDKLLLIRHNKIKTIWQFVLISGLILFIFLGLLIYRNLKISLKNKDLNEMLLLKDKLQLSTALELKHKDLENKNKDLENFALRIVEKNRFIENIEKEIDALQGTEKDKKQLLKITNTIRNNIAIENEIFDVEKKINESYNGFFKRLEIKHPDLTKSEKRLCTFILLNLDNKKVASLMNITAETVKKNRQRLRGKLNLIPEQDTTDYLKAL